VTPQSRAEARALAAPATASTQQYHATFVEIGDAIPGGSCGSATISEIGHVAYQCVAFNACGPNCELRTITFDDGSTLVMHESIVGVISPGNSAAAGTNAPMFLEITQTIVGGTGRFAGATRQRYRPCQSRRRGAHHRLGNDHGAMNPQTEGVAKEQTTSRGSTARGKWLPTCRGESRTRA